LAKAFLILLSLSIVLIVSGLIAAFYTKTLIQLTHFTPPAGSSPIPDEKLEINEHPYLALGISAILFGVLTLVAALVYLQRLR